MLRWQEVKDNDYNLNIPRYVDTFEAEDEIDLNAIAQQLKELEQQSQNTDKVIAEFCKELGNWFTFCGGEVMATPKLRFQEFDGNWDK